MTETIALPDASATVAVPSASKRTFRVEVIENDTDLATLRGEWSELLAASRSDSLFLTWEWLHTWWVHLGRGKRLFVVAVRSGSQLVAIAPLTLTSTWVGPFAIPLLEFAGTGAVGSDYMDIIVRTECEAGALRALGAFLSGNGFSLRLTRVKEDAAVATFLRRDLADRGWDCLESPMDICPFIDLSGACWASYLASRGPRHRYNYKRRLRNLQRDHDVRLEQVHSEADRRSALAHLVKLHLLRWRSRGGTTALRDDRLVAFHESVSRLALERGWLRLVVLKLDGVAAAALYGFRYGQTFHFYQSGFDPDFQRKSVGLVTLALTIRDAIDEGIVEYDFLHGDEEYKFLWATEVRRLIRLDLYPPGLTGRVHRNTSRVIATAKTLIRRTLPKRSAPLTVSARDRA